MNLSLLTFPTARDIAAKLFSFADLCAIARVFGILELDVMKMEIDLHGLDAVREAMRGSQLRLGCLVFNLPIAEGDVAGVDLPMHEALDMAQVLGCNTIIAIPYNYTPPDFSALDRKTALYNLVEGYTRAVQLAEGSGIQVCFEDTPNALLPLSGREDCRNVLQQVPGLGLVYDTANMLPVGEDPIAFYDALKENICRVHLKDVYYDIHGPEQCADGRYINCCPWGQGVVPVAQIIRRMKQDRLDRLSWAIELCAPAEHSKEAYHAQLKLYFDYLTANGLQ